MIRNVDLKIGDRFQHETVPDSRVIGLDRYKMNTFEGRRLNWVSYTLTSEEDGPFARWWLVNMPLIGPCVYQPTENVPGGAEFMSELSGLVILDSKGDSSLSTNNGAAAIYKDKNGNFYAQEIFDNNEKITFFGRPL